MMRGITLVTVVLSLVVCLHAKSKKQYTPPHCTQVTKDTDYASHFKYDYPKAYIPPGQREAFQKLYCIKPPTVTKAVTTVCDWTAPPLVQFTMGDEYMHVIRQDPSGHFRGNAVVTTHQLCNHNLVPTNATAIITSL